MWPDVSDLIDVIGGVVTDAALTVNGERRNVTAMCDPLIVKGTLKGGAPSYWSWAAPQIDRSLPLRDRLAARVAEWRAMDRRDLSAGAMLEELAVMLEGEG